MGSRPASEVGRVTASIITYSEHVGLATRTEIPLPGDLRRFIDDTHQFRQFSCPDCERLIESEIAFSTEAPLPDIEPGQPLSAGQYRVEALSIGFSGHPIQRK